ncbi:MAG: peptidyl-prolyl cis-trans isomerase [Gammaproteobacteria bacterium]|nr:peptidyl-prolyl cis-trans isomerase [Gammaproteobacteria bacterium]
MKRLLLVFCLLVPLTIAGSALAADPQVKLSTNRGDIVLQLDPTHAPASVENFLAYVDAGFYDGTIFHRVIKDFMIQGGGFTQSYDRKETRGEIQNEADNGLRNDRGTIAMARTSDPHSATAQFFINHKDNDFLNHSGKSMRGWGYAVFGKVVAGMEVVDGIADAKTGPGGPFASDAPIEMVIIEKAERL